MAKGRPGTGRPRGMAPEIRELVRVAVRAGWEVRLAGSGHVRFQRPGGGVRVVSPLTPSCRRAWLNVRADLRRAGLGI